MPQIWASDNTDAMSRSKIQYSYSYGYPMSVISSHVSGTPNHQTLRETSLECRFDVAAFGILGYECNLCDLKQWEKKAIKEQITFYKNHRESLQFGDFYRMSNENGYQWITVSKDQEKAFMCYVKLLNCANDVEKNIKTKGLVEDRKYRMTNRPIEVSIKEYGDLINTVLPIHIKKDSLLHHAIDHVKKLEGEKECLEAYGDLFQYAGIWLNPSFGGTGYQEGIRHMPDFSARMYLFEVIE